MTAELIIDVTTGLALVHTITPGPRRRIRFSPGNAEAVPFADAAFDAAFSITVLEECDADRAIRKWRRCWREVC